MAAGNTSYLPYDSYGKDGKSVQRYCTLKSNIYLISYQTEGPSYTIPCHGIYLLVQNWSAVENFLLSGVFFKIILNEK